MDIAPFESIVQFLSQSNESVLITGSAGTGKTTLIRYLQQQSLPQIVLAPTGIAALQAGGQTIHSFFNLPPYPQNFSDLQPLYQKKRLLAKELKRIIIDEISMVRSDIIDKIDYILKITRRNSLPFGGIQVVMVGDFYQLPPVVAGKELQLLQLMGYDSANPLTAKVFDALPVHHFELTHNFRQQDALFIDLLKNVREKHHVESTVQELNHWCYKKHRQGVTPVILIGHNHDADLYNQQCLNQLPSEAFVYEGVKKGKFQTQSDSQRLPAPVDLRLKKGARVMVTQNLPDLGVMNGTLGTITNLTNQKVVIITDAQQEVTLESYKWNLYHYVLNDDSGIVETEVAGSYEQFPLTLAWANTVHKAQGLTLNDVRVNFRRGAFATGQVYVALSRATSLEGLSLVSALTADDIKIDTELVSILQARTVKGIV